MKKTVMISAAIAVLLPLFSLSAQASGAGQNVKNEVKVEKTDTFQIIGDTTENGVRHIKAVPCNKVCSSLIEFDIKKGRIYNLVYTRGCNGNLKAIGKLVEGMTVKKAIETLGGVECGKRGTSCTDQLAQVLMAL